MINAHYIYSVLEAAMKNDGIAVTKAGNLNTKNIIHIDTKYKTKEWLEPIEKSLKKAEEMGITSVAFPTLGISKYWVLPD